jgi:hypothetical protein
LRLKGALERLTITRLSWRGAFYLLEFRDRVALEHGLELRNEDLRTIRTGVAHLAIPATEPDPKRALDWLEGLLKGRRRARKMHPREALE